MMFIGEASKLSGVSVKAIRHYENLGLLPGLGRSGSYRTFSKGDIATIRLIREARNLGFKLSEIKEAFIVSDGSSWAQIEKMLRLKESQIEEDIRILKEKQLSLKQYSELISECLAEDPDCSEPLTGQII